MADAIIRTRKEITTTGFDWSEEFQDQIYHHLLQVLEDKGYDTDKDIDDICPKLVIEFDEVK